MNSTEVEDFILSTINDNIDDHSNLFSTIKNLYEIYPDFSILKFFFFKITKLNYSENEAKFLFENIIKHCSFLSLKLEKTINFYVGFMDYIIERNKILMDQVSIDLYISGSDDINYHKDTLTSIFNRRYLKKALNAEINRSKRKKDIFSVMLLDIDRFSMVNNNYGYNAGDHVLIEVTERIEKNTRAEDTLIRFFDDRFILILPQTGLDGADTLGKRIHSGFLSDQIQIDGRLLNIILSIAIVEYPKHCDTIDDIINVLEQTRYKSKEMGGGMIAWPK